MYRNANFQIIWGIILLCVVAVHFFPFALAAQPHFIGLVLSNTCLTQIKNHVNSTCPTYQDIWHWDQSVQQVSGKLVLDPYPHREPTKMKSECMYYKYYNKDYLIFVDPSSSLQFNCGMQEIVLENSDFIFISDKDKAKNSTQLLTHHESRIQTGCAIVHIDFNKVSVDDTISYMESGCTTSIFNDTKSKPQHDTKVDLSKTYEYIKQAWLHNPNNKQNCLTIKCNTIDPFKKAAWGK